MTTRMRPRKPARPITEPIGHCHTCGRPKFATRAAAKTAWKRRFPGQPADLYQCGAYWHARPASKGEAA